MARGKAIDYECVWKEVYSNALKRELMLLLRLDFIYHPIMYLRFVVKRKDPDSGKRLGIFQALAELRDHGELREHELDVMRELHQWFNVQLEKPTTFSRSSKPHAMDKAISWFKDSALEHIERMREIVAILEEHGVHVEILQTDRPGYVVYEDDFQIAAEAFRDTAA
ncbi:MAG: hypothetical protein L0H94_00680 [Nitrospira sp.]|nr:hypothetical protein [Nitrospira sp.]